MSTPLQSAFQRPSRRRPNKQEADDMDRKSTNGGEAKDESDGWSAEVAPPVCAQYAELIETVWRCERTWSREDRINAAIRNSRNS